MAVEPEVLNRARRGNLRAAITVMSDCYPRVQRMAMGLSGRDDVGRSTVQFVMRRGLRVLPSWLDPSEPMRWCQHHTVLTVRRASKHPPDVAQDTLVRNAKTDNTYYAAFIRALRALPMQQREAFILTHGEQLDLRNLSVAMDCSTEAASNHLRQATQSLTALASNYFAAFTAHLTHTYKALSPHDDLVLLNVRWNARRYHWPRRVYRWVKLLFAALLIGAVLLAIWMFPKLVY